MIRGRLRAGRLDLLRHRHEPRPGPDPRRRALGRRRRDRERHHATSRSTCPATTRSTPGSRSASACPVDDPAVPGMLEKYTRVFEDAVRLMADCFDLELDEVRFSYELGACTKDVDLGWYQLPEGLARRLLPQVPGHGRRRAPGRDAPRVADDAAHRPAAGTSRAATSPRSRATRASTTST